MPEAAQPNRTRAMVLAGMALALCSYLATSAWGVWLFSVAMAINLLLLGLLMLGLRIVRRPQLSMRALVFVGPILTALVVLLVAELNMSRKRQLLLKQAQVQAVYHQDGVYGAFNRALSTNLGSSYATTLPTDVLELGMELDCRLSPQIDPAGSSDPTGSHPTVLDQLPLERLERVMLFQLFGAKRPFATETLSWLNQLPGNVKIELLCQPLAPSDAIQLRKLERPLDRFMITGAKPTGAGAPPGPRPLVSPHDLALMLAIPANDIQISSVQLDVSVEPAVPAAPSCTLTLSDMPAAVGIKLARWKNCQSLTFLPASPLTMQGCRELASLKNLKVLQWIVIDKEQLDVLMASPSLTYIVADVRGLTEPERKQLETNAAGRLRLTISK